MHSERDRAALFDDIYHKIMRRDAFVPIKNQHINLNIRAALLAHRDAVIAADSHEKLFYALLRLNNARKDVHVRIGLVPGGIHLDGVNASSGILRSDQIPVENSPLRFAVDYGEPGGYFFFVCDYAKEIESMIDPIPSSGDRLEAVNGYPIDDYFYMMEPYQRWSTIEGLWWRQSEFLSKRSREFSPNIYRKDVHYALRRRDGTTYDIHLPYFEGGQPLEWSGHWPMQGDERYPGFVKQFSRDCFDVYLYTEGRSVVLLDWNAFRVRSVIEDTDYLLSWARESNLLESDVIFDGTRARGGGYGPYVLQAISPRSFKTTYGNLRISDIIEPFIERIRQGREEGAPLDDIDAGVWMDDGAWVWDWLINDVRQAAARNDAYSNDVPFKSTHLPKDSDGVLYPHDTHFTGRLACLFGPHGGSHLDQFASIVTDNKLGLTIGMSTAGYSNTWEWEELVRFPTTGAPAISMMWSMGHTVRPNGQLLEGNPPEVDEFVPQTRDNYQTYYLELIDRALRYFRQQSDHRI